MKFYEKLKLSSKGFRLFNIDGKKEVMFEMPLYDVLRNLAYLPDSENLANNPKYKSSEEYIGWSVAHNKERIFFKDGHPLSSIIENEFETTKPEVFADKRIGKDEKDRIKNVAKRLDRLWT